MLDFASVTPKKAIELQKSLREKVRLEPLTKVPQIIAGCDVSMNRFSTDGFAGFMLLGYPDLKPIGESVVRGEITFPYIPGLLSFREIPLLLKAWEKLNPKPSLVVVDGVGIAHPRRMGIATHLGLILGVPTIGCAKNVLTGVYEEPNIEAGSFSYLHDPKTGERIGVALRTKQSVKPVFVSPGHLITLEDSIETIRSCVRGYRIPEPTRLAHNAVNRHRIASVNIAV